MNLSRTPTFGNDRSNNWSVPRKCPLAIAYSSCPAKVSVPSASVAETGEPIVVPGAMPGVPVISSNSEIEAVYLLCEKTGLKSLLSITVTINAICIQDE